MTRSEQLAVIKRWIVGLYENDHNNAVFETYNEHCDWNDKERLVDSIENLKVVINDNDFINEVLDVELENDMMPSIMEDLAIWEGN